MIFLPAHRMRRCLPDGARSRRQRIFAPVLTPWTRLSPVLSADHSCRDAVARLLAWSTAQGLKPCSPDLISRAVLAPSRWHTARGFKPCSPGSSYCQARRRLPLELLQNLVRHTGQLASTATQEAWLC